MSEAGFMFVAILKSGTGTQEAVGCLNLLAGALGIHGWTGQSSVYFPFFFLSHTFLFLCVFFLKKKGKWILGRGNGFRVVFLFFLIWIVLV